MKEIVTNDNSTPKNIMEHNDDAVLASKSLMESVLNNPEILSNLLSGNEREIGHVVGNVVVQLSNSSEMQKSFIAHLFEELKTEAAFSENNEKAYIQTNRRDSAFSIITHKNFEPIIKKNLESVFSSYLSSVHSQNDENDPFTGSIDTLLETGKVILKHFPVNRDYRRQILYIWRSLLKKFPKDERNHMLLGIKEIKFIMSDNYLYDSKVKELINEKKLQNKEIAENLKVSENSVINSIKRLKKLYTLEKRESGKKKGRSKRVAERDKEVLKLVGKMKHVEIAEILNINTYLVGDSVKFLRKSGQLKE